MINMNKPGKKKLKCNLCCICVDWDKKYPQEGDIMRAL